MNERIAKTIVKDKFWVVEDQGEKVATIQAREDGGYVYVHDEQREYFPSVKNLKQKYNIKFSGANRLTKSETNLVYGYPITGRAHNQVFDIQRRLPVYTKTPKSRSLFCAGYYIVKINHAWTAAFCPKNITLNRYEYVGPYVNETVMQNQLKELNAKS